MTLASRTVRNTALVSGARLASKALSYVAVLLAFHIVRPDDYGKFTWLITVSALASFIADLGFWPLFTREVAKEPSRLSPYLNSILSAKLLLSIPTLAVVFAAILLLQPDRVPFVLPVFAVLILTSFANQLRGAFYATQRLHYEMVAIIAESVVLVAGVAAMGLLGLAWWWLIWVYAASYGFTVVYAAVVLVARFGHRFRFDLDMARLTALGRQSLPFGLAFVISVLYFKVDVLFLQQLTGNDRTVGIYGAVYKYLEAVTFIPQTLMQPIYPVLSMLGHTSRERMPGVVAKAYKLLAVVGTPTAVLIIVLAPAILHYGSPLYEDGVPILRVLGLGIFFLFVNNTFIYTLNAMDRQSDSTRLAVISLVVNVLLNLVLIPQHSALYGGSMGAAWATTVTELVLLVGGWYMVRRQFFSIPLLSTLRGVLPAGGLCLLATFAVVYALPHNVPGYLAAAITGSAVYGAGLFALRAFTPDELALAREGLRSLARR